MALTGAEKKRLNDGIFVGQEARKYFPEGVLIEAKAYERELAVKQTTDALKSGARTMFEAAIIDNELIVRPDVLHRAGSSWNLYEVKAVTYKEKPDKCEHLERLQDVAIQVYVLRKAGWQIDRAFLTLLNPDCLYPDLENLFIHQDVSSDILPILESLPQEITKSNLSLSLGQEPDIDIGEYCLQPRESAHLGLIVGGMCLAPAYLTSQDAERRHGIFIVPERFALRNYPLMSLPMFNVA